MQLPTKVSMSNQQRLDALPPQLHVASHLKLKTTVSGLAFYDIVVHNECSHWLHEWVSCWEVALQMQQAQPMKFIEAEVYSVAGGHARFRLMRVQADVAVQFQQSVFA